jgi:predicted aldo/keto reductase-like oxidoreductase
MTFNQKNLLGKTGLKAGRLGIASSYGAPAKAFEEAFEKGCNYFTWGTFIKGRSSKMKEAILNITKKGLREELILSMLSYAHNGFLIELFLKKGLKTLNLDHADVLILGYYSKRPPQSVIDSALKLKEKGLIRYLGITSHNRNIFPALFEENLFDIFHIRYSAAHRGAETEVFPYLQGTNQPGVVSFTATRWGRLLKQKKMPPQETAPSAADCYRFVLTNPAVQVCMMGAKTDTQMKENLTVLDLGPMSEDEMDRMRKIGDFVYGKK